MTSNSTVNQIHNRGETYINSYNNLVVSCWQSHCGCSQPGLQLKCQTCPFAIEFIQKIQQDLDPDSKLGMAEIFPLQLSPPYSEEIKQRCLKMFQLGYSLKQIQKFTGVESVGTLRYWLLQSGIYKSAEEYSPRQKQQCLDLYLAGKTPLEIEEETKISKLVLSIWIHSSGIPTRPRKTHYSDEQTKLAIEMYIEGKSYSQIKAKTGVSAHRVRQLAIEQKIQRKKIPKSGRPPVYSPEIKQQCLDLLAQAFSLKQIEELTGVSTSSIQQWHKDSLAQQESDS